MGIFKQDDPPKPQPDFSNVQSGSSSTAPEVGAETYVVQSGDSLWKIAKKLYGAGKNWQRIYAANRETIGSNPDLIQPGQKLNIPRD